MIIIIGTNRRSRRATCSLCIPDLASDFQSSSEADESVECRDFDFTHVGDGYPIIIQRC